MSDAPATAPAAPASAPAPAGGHGGHDAHGQSHYIKIWGILLGLLVVSVIGPMIGIPLLTLFTAFGIALIKAYLVIKHFMHLTVEKKYVGFLLLTMLAFMLVFVGGVSPDVLKHDGQRWTNDAAQAVVKKGLAEDAKGGEEHHGGEEKH